MNWTPLYRLFFCAPLLLQASCLFEVTGSGRLIEVEQYVGDFHRLELSDAFRAELVQSEKPGLWLRVDDNILQYLQVERDGGTVSLSLDEFGSYNNVTLEVRAQASELRELDLSGAASADLSGLCSPGTLDLELSGASRVTGQVKARRLLLDLSGASSVRLSGESPELELEASGASRVGLEHLQARHVTVDLSGASQGAVRATSSLRGELSGASRLDVYGAPAIGPLDLSGASAVYELEGE